MIVEEKGGWSVKSETGKHLGGPYPSLETAKKRLRMIEYFKRKKQR
jgi:hypothetical protein